jgi:hypothetical protein
MGVHITSPAWWLNMFITTFVTMIFIYLIKRATEKINVPVVSDITKSV